MKKIKVGVLGAYRGTSMINYCKVANNAEVVAICDNWPEALERQKNACEGLNITFYDNFDDFIKHDMDAVVLANFATEHAPFAIRCMKAGKHVFSEVLPCQTMKEAVELVEAVEETGMVYAYGENYCYMPAPMEMKRLYQQDKIGELEYAECEYLHNCDKIWPSIAYGDPNHWRNNMYSTFYCTHSLGPILHICGLRPVSVVGFEGGGDSNSLSTGRRSKNYGIEMVTLENGAIVKSIHGATYKDGKWYRVEGTKGRMESARRDANNGEIHRIYVSTDEYPGGYDTAKLETYLADENCDEIIRGFGHGGSDFYSMYHFINKLQGDKDADIIDVYEALDMFLPGLFAFRSILQGGVTMQIPNLRDKAEREQWRSDVACTDPKVAGEQLLPCRKGGNLDICAEVYEEQKRLFLEDLQSSSGYSSQAFTQSSVKKEK